MYSGLQRFLSLSWSLVFYSARRTENWLKLIKISLICKLYVLKLYLAYEGVIAIWKRSEVFEPILSKEADILADCNQQLTV